MITRDAQGRLELDIQPFLFDQNNQKFVEGRDTYFSAPPRVLGCLLMLLMVLSCCAIIPLGNETWQWWRLYEGGATVPGVVAGQRVEGDDHYLSYAFNIPTLSGDPRRYSSEEQVDEQISQSLPMNATVEVRYLVRDPAVASITWRTEYGQTLVLGWGLIGLSFAIGFAALIVEFLRGDRINRRVVFIQGEMVQCVGTQDSANSFMVTLDYRFQTPTGTMITKQKRATRNDLAETPLPAPGTPLVIAYLSDTRYWLL